jgi:hypothetical protein
MFETCLRRSVLVLLAPAIASAQIVVPSGFDAVSLPTGVSVTAIAVGSGGAFGNYAYVSASGLVKRLDIDTGAVTSFASGLSAGANSPSGMAFDPGTFGPGLLFVAQNGNSVVSVSSAGVVTPFSSGTTLFSCNDCVFAPVGSAFGAHLLVTNGNPGTGTVSKVDSAGVNSLLLAAANFSNAPLGSDFAASGSAFGVDLYISEYTTGRLMRCTSAGTVTPFATGLGTSIDVAFSPNIAGPFGDFAYVSDPQQGRVHRVAPNGTSIVWATGFVFGGSGFDADLAFTPDGSAMLVASGSDVVRIRGCGVIATYCTAGTTTHGCNATMSGTGTPSASQSSGFVISTQNVEGNKSSLFFYGLSGSFAQPWGGGSSSYLCVKSPTQRTTVLNSGGTPEQCDGAVQLDWNAYRASHPTTLGAPFAGGEHVWVQLWFRDPASSKTTSLSDAMHFVVCP